MFDDMDEPVCDELDIGSKRARDAHSFALDARLHLRASLPILAKCFQS